MEIGRTRKNDGIWRGEEIAGEYFRLEAAEGGWGTFIHQLSAGLKAENWLV
jgi:hypothetical protein